MLKKGKLIPVLEHNVLLGDLYLITNFGLYSENCSQSVVTMFLVLNGTNIDYHQCTNKNQGTQKTMFNEDWPAFFILSKYISHTCNILN